MTCWRLEIGTSFGEFSDKRALKYLDRKQIKKIKPLATFDKIMK